MLVRDGWPWKDPDVLAWWVEGDRVAVSVWDAQGQRQKLRLTPATALLLLDAHHAAGSHHAQGDAMPGFHLRPAEGMVLAVHPLSNGLIEVRLEGPGCGESQGVLHLSPTEAEALSHVLVLACQRVRQRQERERSVPGRADGRAWEPSR